MEERKTDSALICESIRSVLGAKVADDELKKKLKRMGLKDATLLDAIHAAMGEKAAGGDVSAARYLRDTLEESRQALDGEEGELDRLELSKWSDEALLALIAAWEEQETGAREG